MTLADDLERALQAKAPGAHQDLVHLWVEALLEIPYLQQADRGREITSTLCRALESCVVCLRAHNAHPVADFANRALASAEQYVTYNPGATTRQPHQQPHPKEASS